MVVYTYTYLGCPCYWVLQNYPNRLCNDRRSFLFLLSSENFFEICVEGMKKLFLCKAKRYTMTDTKKSSSSPPSLSEKSFLKNVREVQQKSGITLDSSNEEAMKIGESKGVGAMVEHMVKGRTYSEMRSMFG